MVVYLILLFRFKEFIYNKNLYPQIMITNSGLLGKPTVYILNFKQSLYGNQWGLLNQSDDFKDGLK